MADTAFLLHACGGRRIVLARHVARGNPKPMRTLVTHSKRKRFVMVYPLVNTDLPGHFIRQGVISPEGRCVAREEVSPDHPRDIRFGLEIGATSGDDLTPDQKRTALALLDQTVAGARIFLGKKPRTGLQPGMTVVLVGFKNDHYLGILEDIDANIIRVRTFLKNGEMSIADFPRSASFMREVPGHFGMEGLAHAAFFLNKIFDWSEDHPRDFYSDTVGVSLLAFISDQESLVAIANASSMFANHEQTRHHAIRRVESFRAIIEMIERLFLSRGDYQREDLPILGERATALLKSASLEGVGFIIARFTDESLEHHRKLKSNRIVEYLVEKARERAKELPMRTSFFGEAGD